MTSCDTLAYLSDKNYKVKILNPYVCNGFFFTNLKGRASLCNGGIFISLEEKKRI